MNNTPASSNTTVRLHPHRWVAELWLVVMTVFWGSSFTAIKTGLEGTSPTGLVAYRFTIATAVFLLLAPGVLKELRTVGFRYGLFLAVILYFGYVLQTMGLEMTTASRSAFVTSLHAAFVPLIWLCIARKIPQRNTLAGLGIAMVGLYFLLVKPEETQNLHLNRGDVLTVFSAFAWAVYIVTLPILSKKSQFRPLMFGQLFGMAVLCWLVAGFQGSFPMVDTGKSFFMILYLATMCTLVTVFLQTRYQQYTLAPRAAVIYTLEPVCAACIAFLFLSERMTGREMFGAALIFGGVLFSELA
ncbi:MAG TPA: DMT family transporter [bacterium]|nr:DMT family transporter [bacterium]